MQFKTILAISLFSAAQVACASPPPCLLAAVNSQSNPTDYKTICGDNASEVQKQIKSVCKGDDATAALSSFADTCKNNGVTISSAPPSSSTSAPTSSSGSGSGTNTPYTTTTGASSVSGTSHGSGSATATGSHSMSTGTGSMTMSMPTASGSATKTSGTSNTAAGSAKPSTTSGVAGQLAGSIGGLAMVAAGAIFML